ncbi:MAG: hypothetical protein KAX38_04210, partial [Candidatus Krumholzibacteria bacterium]|nr:hypothetical protein [Candidatus Krumholzibacteria bacterium]
MPATRVIFFFLSIQFFLYNMGLLGRRLSLLASVVSLLVFIALSLPERGLINKKVHAIPALCLVLVLIVIARGSYEEIFVFPALLASLLLLPGREDHGEGEREALVLGSFLFSALVLLQFHVPVLWYVFHVWGLGFSRFAGRLIGQPYLLGQTASGVPIFLLFLSYYAAVSILAR